MVVGSTSVVIQKQTVVIGDFTHRGLSPIDLLQGTNGGMLGKRYVVGSLIKFVFSRV